MTGLWKGFSVSANLELAPPAAPPQGWRTRIGALRHVSPVFSMVWESDPGSVVAVIITRLCAALLPLALLAVTRFIIDSIVGHVSHRAALPAIFWWIVFLEFALAALAGGLSRCTDYFDSVWADRFTCHVGVRIMEHGARLDLPAYENADF